MRKYKGFRKFLIVLAFVIFPLTGYMTVSNVTSCQAQSCPCGVNTNCIAANSLSDALNTIYNNVIVPAMQQTVGILTTYFTPYTINFNAGMLPIAGGNNNGVHEQGWFLRQLISLFDTFWYYNLLPTMQAMTRELSVANIEQSEALGSFSDAANIIRARRVLSDMSIDDHRAVRPSGNVCTVATMMGGMVRATGFSDDYNAAAAAGKIWRSMNKQDMPSGGGFALDVNSRWYGGFVNNWCDPTYNNGSTNPASINYGAAGCKVPGIWVGQDVDVAGLIFGQDTIDLTPDNPAACQADNNSPPLKCDSVVKDNLDELFANLAEPFVKDPVTANSKAGKTAILESVSYKAKRQVVYDGLYYIASRRVPGGLRQQSAGMPQVAAGAPDYVKFLDEIRALTGEDSPSLSSPNPSRNEILRALMTQRFRSGRYSLSQVDEPENNRREMIVDQALQLIQMSDQLDMMDHYALLLASQVSTEVKGEASFSAATAGAPLR